ncbi:RNA methyltransferase [Cecembia calidifontis]|jgi:tRNA G18 (ribose-2'-O)-methylase SpoU|uniref:SpoU rRNA methylase family protein n=1 Tax=Cecembia calidifontis TaxID=1187080 RepID=A0A4Q7PA59_9BACT|nr:RNA methyltransferase [Cecembia calidifontis]RZS95632.1 SpoU rRNA methylase family protein [Cecembia calidifontis]
MKKLSMEELNRLSVEEFKKTDKTPLAIVLDNVRSLNNVGSAFRTSDAFLIEKICLCGITGTPPHREIQKTALGATESVEWEYHDTTAGAIDQLRREGFVICSFEQVDQSVFLNEFHPEQEKKYALVFGNEVFGIDHEVILSSDHVLEIPQLGTKHSLNISVSMGIAIWDFVVKMKLLQPRP